MHNVFYATFLKRKVINQYIYKGQFCEAVVVIWLCLLYFTVLLYLKVDSGVLCAHGLGLLEEYVDSLTV